MPKRLQEIIAFEELEEYLREFRVFRHGSLPSEYDFGGAVYLLAACLDNLRSHALDAQLEEIGNYLDPENMTFLHQLSDHLKAWREERDDETDMTSKET